MNQLVLKAVLVQRAQLRYTPAGLAVLDMRLNHEMTRSVLGVDRQIKLEIAAQAWEKVAHDLLDFSLGASALFTGFLNRSGRSSSSLVFHIDTVEK